jgi:hypothetical protein
MFVSMRKVGNALLTTKHLSCHEIGAALACAMSSSLVRILVMEGSAFDSSDTAVVPLTAFPPESSAVLLSNSDCCFSTSWIVP